MNKKKYQDYDLKEYVNKFNVSPKTIRDPKYWKSNPQLMLLLDLECMPYGVRVFSTGK